MERNFLIFNFSFIYITSVFVLPTCGLIIRIWYKLNKKGKKSNLKTRKIGVIIILIIYLFYDYDNLNNWITKRIPYPEHPKKIDVGQGEDVWFLTEEDELHHWSPTLNSLVMKQRNILDFAVGSDGTVVYINKDNDVYIRTIHVDACDGKYDHRNITVCDYNMIFTTDLSDHFIQGTYDIEADGYYWECVDCINYYHQISCAIRDNSLWIRGSGDYIYRYIANNKHIARSETQLKQVKALSEQHAIGVDYNNILWEYVDGIWWWKKRNVKSASINYDAKGNSKK